MTTKPILFSGPMVRAILDERKHQTRRVLKPQPESHLRFSVLQDGVAVFRSHGGLRQDVKAPYAPGDLIYVREEHYCLGHWEPVPGVKTKGGRQKWRFVADSRDVLFDPPAVFRSGLHHSDPASVTWYKRLGRFMPRALSRLTLEVTAVRIERVQDISCADALAEGVTWPDPEMEAKGEPSGSPITAFEELWDGLNERRGYGWDANPWVAAVTFKAHHCNADSYSGASRP